MNREGGNTTHVHYNFVVAKPIVKLKIATVIKFYTDSVFGNHSNDMFLAVLYYCLLKIIYSGRGGGREKSKKNDT